jgi:molybdopterin-guanine dinucleotide biosynthesis protein A
MRWQPGASWLFVACDLPLVSTGALEWLLASRRPGVWATIPQLESGQGLEPLLAHYDYRSRPLLEQGRRPIDIVGSDRVATPRIPPELAAAWRNINTREELQRLSET